MARTVSWRVRAAAALALAAGTGLAACAEAAPVDEGGSAADAGASAVSVAPVDSGDDGQVVVYTSVDRTFSEPVLTAYAAATGVEVLPVYDLEAAKTTGLVSRLMAEAPRPQADVWWNGEFAQTLELAEAGVLAAYESPNAVAIPEAYRDPQNRWTGFGGRARVFLVNTDLVAAGDEPHSIRDMLDAPEPGKVGIALPVFGTAATQAAALYAAWGREETRAFFAALADSGVQVVDGNSVVRDMVADGRLAWGLTDTDDACGALERGSPVKVVFPDQRAGEDGTLIVPNTVALVEGAPHPLQGKALVDYLLAESTTATLVETGWFQVTLRPIPTDSACLDATGVRGMSVPLADIGSHIGDVTTDLSDLFIAP